MSWDVTHAAYSQTYQLIRNLVRRALGRVGGAGEADTPTFSEPASQASEDIACAQQLEWWGLGWLGKPCPAAPTTGNTNKQLALTGHSLNVRLSPEHVPVSTLGGRCCFYSHFTDEGAEAHSVCCG